MHVLISSFCNVGDWSAFIKVSSTRKDRRLWAILLSRKKCDKASSGIGTCCFYYDYHIIFTLSGTYEMVYELQLFNHIGDGGFNGCENRWPHWIAAVWRGMESV